MTDPPETKGASAHQLHVFELLLSGKILNARDSGCPGQAAAYEDVLRMFHAICGKFEVKRLEKKPDSPVVSSRYSLHRNRRRGK